MSMPLTWIIFSQVLDALSIKQFRLFQGVKDVIHAVECDAQLGRVDNAEPYPSLKQQGFHLVEGGPSLCHSDADL